MIPFYSDSRLPEHEQKVSRFGEFIVNAKSLTGFNLAVVDDGSKLDPERFRPTVDVLVQRPENRGKAQAVRQGMAALLSDPTLRTDFIVQYDGDGDQSFADVPGIMDSLIRASEENPGKPALVIGERYSEGLRTAPNPNSVTYRQSILIFFGAISRQFGFDVRDWVSGARGYTQEYARRFLGRSQSNNYGIEAEQLVLAYLEGASVHTAPLTDSRPRDPHTDTSKWLQNFDVFLLYGDELRGRGQENLVGILEKLTHQLRNGSDVFELDLSPIGENTSMRFERHNGAHTAEIPYGYRSRVFSGEGGFPFALKKEVY